MPSLHWLGPVSPLSRGHAATDLAHLFALIDDTRSIRSTRLRLAARVPLLAQLSALDRLRQRLDPEDSARLASRLRQSMIRDIERQSRALGPAHRGLIDALEGRLQIDVIQAVIHRVRGLNPGDGWTHRASRLRRPRPGLMEAQVVGALLGGRYDELARLGQQRSMVPALRRLVRTGVHVDHDGSQRFMGAADDEAARTLPPSLPLLIALSRQPATLSLAERMLHRLSAGARDGARAWLSAGYAIAGSMTSAQRSWASIQHRSWRDEALRLMIGACIERGELDVAATLIERFDSGRKARDAWLELASDRALAGDGPGVHWATRSLGDPDGGGVRRILSVQLALARGRIQRAAVLLMRVAVPQSRSPRRQTGPARWCPPALRRLPDHVRVAACAVAVAVHDRSARARLHARSSGALGLEAAQSLLDRPQLLDRLLDPHVVAPRPALERAARLPSPFADLVRTRLAERWHRSIQSRPLDGRVESLLTQARPVRDPAEAFVAGVFDGVGALEVLRSAPPLLRAFHDEGRSLGPRSDRRRRSLLGVARAVLRTSSCGDAISASVLASRLRCIRNLAASGHGLAAADTLGRILDAGGGDSIDCAARESAWRLLLSLDPHRAVSLSSRRHHALTRGGRRAHAVIGALIRSGALPGELFEAWAALERRGRRVVGASCFHRWWSELSRAWFDRFGRPPTAALIDKIDAEGLERTLRRPPSEFVERLVREHAAAFDRPLCALPKALHRRPQTLSWLESLDPIRRARPWSAERIDRAIGRLARRTADIDPGRAKDALSRLPEPDDLWRRAQRGAPWVDGFDAHAPEDLPGHHRLVWLHKARDLFRWLRFADDVRCCFNSDSWHYEHGLCTWQDIRDLWLDPLSFCLEVRTGPATSGRGGGFIFGGLGSTDGQPVLLLNGLYLRRREPRLRAALLTLIELRLCRPLGLRRIAIANRFGGCGALPKRYQRQSRRLLRFRALTSSSGPYRNVYDDIGERVNEVQMVDHLYWSVVEAPEYGSKRLGTPRRPTDVQTRSGPKG